MVAVLIIIVALIFCLQSRNEKNKSNKKRQLTDPQSPLSERTRKKLGRVDTVSSSKSEKLPISANPLKQKLYNNVRRGLHFDERKALVKVMNPDSQSEVQSL